MTTEGRFIVGPKSFWTELPHYQELTCGRKRLAHSQFVSSDPSLQYFSTKFEALRTVFNAPQSLALIYEHQYDEKTWVYEILIGASRQDADS